MTATADNEFPAPEIDLIPAMLTNSYHAVVGEFGDSIISITAHGSITTTNPSEVEELRDYGVHQKMETNHQIQIDYSALHTGPDNERVNSLDSQARDDIEEYILSTLDKDDAEVKPDLSVSELTIRVECEPLQEVTTAQSSTFDLTFIADPAEDAVRQATRRANADRGLYQDLNFNIENLNLRSVVESGTHLSDQRDWRCLSWQGPKDIAPRSDDRVASRINDLILPDAYGTLKPYSATDDQYMDIVAEKLEDLMMEDLEAEAPEGGDE